MDIKIALAPTLNVRPEEFATEWNEMEEAQEVARAHLDAQDAVQYDPSLAADGLVVLGSIATGLVTNVIYDLIKQALARRGVRRRTEIRVLEQPDGTMLLVVTTEEE